MSEKDALDTGAVWLPRSKTKSGETGRSGIGLGLRVFRVSLFLIGLGILVWAVTDARFRDYEGFPLGTICLPVVTGICLLGLAWAIGTEWRRFAAWVALALVGQAVTLQLIDAGPLIHYQHLWSFDAVVTQAPWLALFVLVQSVLVIVALVRRFSTIRSWLRYAFRPWQLAVVLVVFVFSTAALSRNVSGYLVETLVAAWIQLVSLGILVLAVWALPEGALAALRSKFDTWLGEPAAPDAVKHSTLDRFAWVAALGVTGVAALLSIFGYQQHPHVPDEVAYLLHARFLAAGAWTLPGPQVPAAFGTYLVQFRGDEWFIPTPPGWPAMLALGVRIGVPWLVNPILAGVCVLLAYLLVQELYDRRMARLAVLLLCVSPWFLFMGMNFMTHTFTLACALAAAVLVAWSKRRGQFFWAFLAGGFVGMGSLIRPLDGLIVAALLGVWLLTVRGWRMRVFLGSAFLIGAVLVGAVVLPYNLALTGRATTFPLNAYLDEQFGPGKNDLGFGENRGYGWGLQPFPGHSPLGAVINTALNTFSLNIELFGWAIGSLLFLTLFLVSLELKRSDFMLLAVVIVTVGVFGLYWYSGGPDFGARYWYLILIPCIVLTIRGMQLAQSKLDSYARRPGPGAHVLAAVLVASLVAFVTFIPWRTLDKYHHYLLMRPDISRLAQQQQFASSLVLVEGNEFPDYASALVYNPLDWNAPAPIYAWSQDTETRNAVLRSYPDRSIWIVAGPSITQQGYRVVAGPLEPGSLSGR